jgi:hypothetical protein
MYLHTQLGSMGQNLQMIAFTSSRIVISVLLHSLS